MTTTLLFFFWQGAQTAGAVAAKPLTISLSTASDLNIELDTARDLNIELSTAPDLNITLDMEGE